MQVFGRSKICKSGLSVNSSSDLSLEDSNSWSISANEIPFSIQFVQASQ